MDHPDGNQMVTAYLNNETYSQLNLESDQQEPIDRMRALAREKFAPRAAHYDETATFPAEDFEDIFRAGLHAPVVPKEHGGLGLGPYRGDVFTFWMMTKEIAKVDLSLARCWEGHCNSLVLLDGMANDEQRARWFFRGRGTRREMGGLERRAAGAQAGRDSTLRDHG